MRPIGQNSSNLRYWTNLSFLPSRTSPFLCHPPKDSFPQASVYASWVISQSYAQTERYQESIAELKKARTIDANWSYLIAELGYAYAASGERSEAERILEQLKERATREYIDSTLIAYMYVGLGQKDKAFAWLEKGYQERSGLMPWLKSEPKLDSLREDARFADLVRRIGTSRVEPTRP
jgi:tetratricopeptide (TPR) repeat protein